MATAEVESMSAISDKIDAFNRSDELRNSLLRGLLHKTEQLQVMLEQQTQDLDNERQSRRQWQEQARTSAAALRELSAGVKSNEFVVVILDGDGALFHDEFYQRGRDGGADAAHKLLQAIKTKLKELCNDSDTTHWTIIIHLMVNASGLARKLHSVGIISDERQLFHFAHGWNTQPNCFWTDVGHGGQRADAKVVKIFELYVPAITCKRVFFGPCSDGGFIPGLEIYKHDSVLSAKICLIECRPALVQFRALQYPMLRFETIFRTTNLPEELTFTSISRSGAHSPPLTTSTPSVASSSSAATQEEQTWATVIRTARGTAQDTVTGQEQAGRYILLNAAGERVDAPLGRPSVVAAARFRERERRDGNLCNAYHLRGYCPIVPADACLYQHGNRLVGEELLALQNKVRHLACEAGRHCRDHYCQYGHNCKHAAGTHPGCRFEHVHGVSLVPVRRLWEGATEPEPYRQ